VIDYVHVGLKQLQVKYLLNIFTTDCQSHTARDSGSGNPMAVAHSYCYKLLTTKGGRTRSRAPHPEEYPPRKDYE